MMMICINSEPGGGGDSQPGKALGTRLGDSAYEMGGDARRKF